MMKILRAQLNVAKSQNSYRVWKIMIHILLCKFDFKINVVQDGLENISALVSTISKCLLTVFSVWVLH